MKATLLSVMGDDLMVVNAARVSMGKKKDQFGDDDAKLIRFLANSKPIHFSPFSHPQLQFHIEAPIFVLRQLYRHQVGLTINEESRRYVDFKPTFFQPDAWRGRPPKSIKQGSGDAFPDTMQMYFMEIMDEAYRTSFFAYQKLIDKGVAPEQARMVLPQAMYTQLYYTGSLFAFARICWNRLESHAQKEIQDLAKQFDAQIEPHFPVSWKALMEAGGVYIPK